MKSISRGPELDAGEREQLAVDGYVLRRGSFSPAEVTEIADACERLVDDGDALLANEIDLDTVANMEGVPLEVEAGSVVFFGAFLVHCSAPNTSDTDRRALLFSYQPPVEPCPTQVDLLRQLGESVGALPRP